MKRVCHNGFLIVFFFSIIFSACAQIERRLTSTPNHQIAEHENDELKEYQKYQLKEEFGWQDRVQLSPAQERRLEIRRKLKQRESQLQTQAEKEQYFRLKGLMRNDLERIEFLDLRSLGEKEKWASDRGLNQAQEGFSDELADLIEKKDIQVKMPKKAVLESWGDPEQIEVAGNPIYGFERWRYIRFESSQQGFKKVERLVYFEAGVVAGWETIHH